jgi:hypothetical protein
MRGWTLVVAAVLGTLLVPGNVVAFWSAGSVPGGGGSATAGSLGTAETPTVSLAGRMAQVDWAQTIVDGTVLGQLAAGGYTARRYAVGSPTNPITPAGGCAGTVSGAADPTGCSEPGLPTGRWRYAVTPVLHAWVGTTSPQSATVIVAPDSPLSVSLTNGGGAGSAYVNAANVTGLSFDVVLPSTSLASDTVTLAMTDGSSTVTATAAGIAGGGTRSLAGVDASGLANGSLTITATATSSAGDVSGATSITRTKDTTAPTSTLALVSQSPAGSSLLTGSRVFYRGTGGGSGGSLTLTNTVADGVSEPASSATAALTGTSTGWTHAPGTVSTPSGGPYVSATFAWSEGTSSSPTETVTSADAAGNTSTQTLTLTNDSTAPTGGSLTANGGSASDTTGIVSLSKVDFAEAPSATQSGLASNALTRASATLSGNICGSFGGAVPVTITGGNDSAMLTTGCYRYTLTGTDNVDNTATATSTIVKVDTSAPGAPALGFSAVAAGAYYPGSGTQVFFRPTAASGGFTVTATATDADTAIAGYAFPATLGTGWTTAGSGASRTYTYAAGAGQPGGQSVTATNNAGGMSAAANFDVTSDATAPTGGALTVNGVAATGVGSTSTNATGSFPIDARTDYAETASATSSGLASSTLTRAQATLTAGTCGAFGAPTTVVGAPAQSGLVDGCYLYTLTGTDNVGNAASVSTTVKVDRAPTIAAVVVSNGGSTAGRIEKGDAIAITFSERMSVASLCSTWSNDSANQSLSANGDVTVTVANGGAANDSLIVASASCAFHFGSIDLGSASYVTANLTASGNGGNRSTIAWNATTFTLTIVLGQVSGGGTIGTVASSVATYAPSGSIVDSSSGQAVVGGYATGNVQQF